ncbi:transporter substrate-binding domain-containing protein [Rhodoligotrophos defluvii]|uniref:transporter substrate-binding domain-containing protein n=1 Tax=Rhodoligotrophos defluvii TaxID=2561934 RepID=UPI001484E330|nr:transporter substrate-binding domain-containing protein [Rhodoligotrophos defluvii]
MTDYFVAARFWAYRVAAGAIALCLLLPVCAVAQAPVEGTQGGELIVGTKEAPPFAMKSEHGEWEGITIDLWRRIADELGLRYRFTETSLQNLILGTANGSFDVAVAALTITAEREKALDFSQPFYETGLSIAVAKRHTSWGKLLHSIISRDMLVGILGLLGALVLVGVLCWLVERRKNRDFTGKQGLIQSLLWSASTATGHASHKTPVTLPGELLAMGWGVTSVLVISTFTALIASALTATQLRGAIHGVDDLRSVHVGTVANSEAVDYLADQRISFQPFPDLQSGLAALKDGTIDAFVYDRPLLAWQINRNYQRSLDLLDPIFDKQSYGIALPTGSGLREPIDRQLLAVTRSDWWRTTTFRYLGESPDHRAPPTGEMALFGHGHH